MVPFNIINPLDSLIQHNTMEEREGSRRKGGQTEGSTYGKVTGTPVQVAPEARGGGAFCAGPVAASGRAQGTIYIPPQSSS